MDIPATWALRPDSARAGLILLQWYVNDVDNGDHSGRLFGSQLISGDAGPGRWLRHLVHRTLFYLMLQQQFDAVQERLGLFESYPAYLHRRFGDPDGPGWTFAASQLRAFIDECRVHHTPVAIAPFPHLSSGLPAGAYEFGALHDNVPDLCRAESIPCVDLAPTFARYQDYRTRWVHRYDPHPGSLVAARQSGSNSDDSLWQRVARPMRVMKAGLERERAPSGSAP